MKFTGFIVNSPAMAHPYQGTITKFWCHECSHNHSFIYQWNMSWNSCKDMEFLANFLFKQDSNKSLSSTVIANGLKSDSNLPKKLCFICFNDSPLKMMKNAFYFTLKALFILKIFMTPWPCWKNGLIRKTRLISKFMTSRPD